MAPLTGTAQRVVHPLEPVYDERSRVLVLGSFPSPKSRESKFYYGHPHNRFWRVMAELFDEPLANTNERRRDQVLRHHIALWDVLASCTITGASDASIADAVPNDIGRILRAAPIGAVFCSGSKAAELYRRHLESDTGTPCVKLPSTSPANAAWSLERLVGAWSVLLPHLHETAAPVLDVSDVVALEQRIARCGTPLAELMDRAGAFLAHRVMRRVPDGCVALLCGNGNNGGDGWVAARVLAQEGREVVLFSAKHPADISAQPARDAAMASAEKLAALGNARVVVAPTAQQVADALERCACIVDAMLGTGFAHSTVREPVATWIALANERRSSGAVTVAADVPSGLSAQDGAAASTCIRADETVTMICGKPGLYSGEGPGACGDVTVAGIANTEGLL